MSSPTSVRIPLARFVLVGLAAALLAACAPAATAPEAIEPAGTAPRETSRGAGATVASTSDAASATDVPGIEPDATAPSRFVPVERTPVLEGAQALERVDRSRGLVTYAESLGAGPQVLLVHGIGGGSSVFQYRRIAPQLADAGYEAIALDLYGFGRSSRPAGALTAETLVDQIEGALDALDGPSVHVVANGLAAAYAVRIAVERSDRVASLSLIVPTGLGRLDRARPTAEEAFRVFGGPLGAVLYGALLGPDVQLRFLLDAYADPSNVDAEVRAAYSRNLYVRNARWAVLSFVSGLLDQDLRELWPHVDVPTWIAWGAAAETTPPSDAERFLEARPGTPLVVYDGAKLLPNVERADAYGADLRRFLAELRPWGEGPEPRAY